ncbi:MAG: RraA family protein [Acidobacteriota bacterium]
MPVHLKDAPFERLSDTELAAWQGAEAAAVSDCLERSMAMDGGIGPLDPTMRVVGQARTVRCMAGDNSALHAAINRVEPGEVLVADASGFLGNAVWGGLMTDAARRKGIAGLVVDGAVRDSAEIVAAGFPCFVRGVVPAGPHKNFGGAIDVPIACGGVAVHPGDLIVGDADGVTVVPLERVEATLAAYHALKEKEARARAALDAGGTLADIYGVPEVTEM